MGQRRTAASGLLIAALSPIAQDVVDCRPGSRLRRSVLIVPDLKACARFLQKEGIGYAQAAAHEELTAWIRSRLQRHAERNRARDALHPPGDAAALVAIAR